MNLFKLPAHATKRHPLTGEPIRPLWVRPDGRIMWPIMGGAPDDGDAAAQAAAAAKAEADGAAAKVAADAAAAKVTETDSELGFPKDTPVVEMTTAQQVAYYKHQSRKHEERATEYRTAAGGKTAAEVKADLENAAALAREKLSDQEKAIEDAKAAVRSEVAGEFGPKAVKTALKLLLGDMPEADQEAEIELLDLGKFLTDSGDVDTAKVRRAAEKIAPAGKDGERRIRDFGAGDRRTNKSSGVAAGRALFEERRGSKSKSTTE